MHVLSLQLNNMRGYIDTEELIFANRVNLFVGPNNSGKSTILRAIYFLQERSALLPDDRRLGADQGHVVITVFGQDVERCIPEDLRQFRSKEEIEQSLIGTMAEGLTVSDEKYLSIRVDFTAEDGVVPDRCFANLPQREPDSFILPHMSRRKPAHLTSNVGSKQTDTVDETRSNLTSKIDALMDRGHLQHERYFQACREVIGIEVSAHQIEEGKRPGIRVGNLGTIGIKSMGEGVLQLAGFIADLVTAKGKVFLIEEPENDIHPTALKALCRLIEDASQHNQFFITTHSHIVAKNLGAIEQSDIFRVNYSLTDNIPTSTIERLPKTPNARRDLLEELGYELYDFDLANAWLILEESSAETLIRDYLIPMFVPSLKYRLHTVSSGGASKVPGRVEALDKLFLFAHLSPAYRERAWVWVDGDEAGTEITKKFRTSSYATDWPKDHFGQFKQSSFEMYYPAEFQERITETLNVDDRDQRRSAKKILLEDIISWLAEDKARARASLEQSAEEVIALLKRIEERLQAKDAGGSIG